jgi:hypothetical protein
MKHGHDGSSGSSAWIRHSSNWMSCCNASDRRDPMAKEDGIGGRGHLTTRDRERHRFGTSIVGVRVACNRVKGFGLVDDEGRMRGVDAVGLGRPLRVIAPRQKCSGRGYRSLNISSVCSSSTSYTKHVYRPANGAPP